MRSIKKNSVDQSVVIRIIDSGDGTPENAVEHDSAGIDLWYRREGATKISITEAALATLDAAHADGGIELIGDGYYRLDLPDAAVATSVNGVMIGGTVTGMIVIGCYVHLVDYDTLEDLSDQIAAIVAGGGSETWPFTLTEAGSGEPVADASVWITADEEGEGEVIASGSTDNFGVVTFFLDPGTYYFWAEKSGWNFTNPYTQEVS